MPALPRVIRRSRLFGELDQALKRRVTWIAGPPGAGKTTLVASYLRARRRPVLWDRLDERDADLSSFVHDLTVATRAMSRRLTRLPVLTADFRHRESVFLRRFFERLGERLPARSVIVFDNFQDAPVDALLHQALPLGLRELGADISVVIVSRDGPPPAFRALQAQGQLTVLPPSTLALTPEELDALVQLHHPSASRAALRAWRRRVQLARGWLAGTTLLLQGTTPATTIAPIAERSDQAVFDYLTHETLDRASPAHQDFLLKTSLLPTFTAAIAHRVTGAAFAAEYLDRLYHSNLFTERTKRDDPWYAYHPLFRECLNDVAQRRLASEGVRRVQQDAGRALVGTGRIEEGIALLTAAGQWGDAADAVQGAAPQLMKQGRVQTLEQWLRHFPVSQLDEHPWLRYWLAVCLVLTGSSDAECFARQAMTAFRNVGDTAGVLASWSLTVAALSTGIGNNSPLDSLIDEFPYQDPSHLPPLPPELTIRVVDAAAIALAFRKPGKPRTNRWVARAVELTRSSPWDGQALMFPWVETYYLSLGDLRAGRAASSVFNEARLGTLSSVPARLACHMVDSLLLCFDGEPDRCRQVIKRGMALIQREGLSSYEHYLVANGVCNELMSGTFHAAGPLIDRMRPPASGEATALASHHALLEAWYRLYVGEIPAAWDLVNPDHHRPQDTFGPYAAGVTWILRAFIKLAAHETTAAEFCSMQAAIVADDMNSDLFRHGVELTQALCAFARGDEVAGYAALARGLTIGRRQGLWGCPGWHVPQVAGLLSRALAAGIETGYVRQLLQKRRVPRPPDAVLPQAWFWPIEIRALGAFVVTIDQVPLRNRRKPPHRLLEVLRAIVALGSSNVRTARLIDFFWPTVDGDTAQENLDKTLQRLRRLLGRSDALLLRKGLVTINPHVCWVDTRAFEELVAKRDPAGAADALTLYRGPLFGPLDLQAWERSARDRFERLRDIAVTFARHGSAPTGSQVRPPAANANPRTTEECT